MKKRKILFIHHSTGGLLIRFGRIRQLLVQLMPDIEFWDHGYNLYPSKILSMILGYLMFRTGLSDAKGRMVGKDFDITISNNSPKEYAEIFSRDPNDPTLKQILNFDVILFKNCFPTSKIETKKKLEEYKAYYGTIIANVRKYPNYFVAFTQPPLRREMTNSVEAVNARELATWLAEQKTKNFSVFNFFNLLSDDTNMLKREYCTPLPFDSHPNIRANSEVGKVFVEWLVMQCSVNLNFG